MKRYDITIEAFSLSLPFCGFREYVERLGRGIGQRAAELRERYGLHFRFVVPIGCKGCFGSDVDYLEVHRKDRHHIDSDPRWTADLYHLPTQACKFRRMSRAPYTLLTLHDVNFMHNKHGLSRQWHRLKVWRKIRHATHYAFISQFSAADSIACFNLDKPYRVIYNGVTDQLSQPANPIEGLPERFLFHISNLNKNKNLPLMLDMMERLPQYHLVIVGPWHKWPDLYRRALDAPNVTPILPVTDAEKAWLFSGCQAFLFPSDCEGFGLPPLEAMSCGKPVFMSSLTCLPEIGADAAIYWPALQADDMAAIVARELPRLENDTTWSEHARSRALDFTWDKCVDGYIAQYLSILGID